jgi:hypothetical protein
LEANLTKLFDDYYNPIPIADFHYLPTYLVPKFCKILKKIYKSNFFFECAVPNAMGIIILKEYQIIHFVGLWTKERNNVVENLHKKYNQITIYPIKFPTLGIEL